MLGSISNWYASSGLSGALPMRFLPAGEGDTLARLGLRGVGGGEDASSMLLTAGGMLVGLLTPGPGTTGTAIEVCLVKLGSPMSSMLRTGDCAAAGLCARPTLASELAFGRLLPSSRAITSLRSSSKADSRDILSSLVMAGLEFCQLKQDMLLAGVSCMVGWGCSTFVFANVFWETKQSLERAIFVFNRRSGEETVDAWNADGDVWGVLAIAPAGGGGGLAAKD